MICSQIYVSINNSHIKQNQNNIINYNKANLSIKYAENKLSRAI
jgi:hypothetical protein